MTFAKKNIEDGIWPSLFQTFGIENGNAKQNSQLLELTNQMKKSAPSPTWEIIEKRVSKKRWEREFPLMSAPLVAYPSDATPYYSSLYKVSLIPSRGNFYIETTLYPSKIFNIFFLSWDWVWESRTVFPTQLGKDFTKEYRKKVGQGNSRSCLQFGIIIVAVRWTQ